MNAPEDDAPFGVRATYAEHTRNLAAYALRTGATAPRDVLAHRASGGRYSAQDLVLRISAHLAHGTGPLTDVVDVRAVGLLATVIGAQSLGPQSSHDAVTLFEWCVATGGRKALRRDERLLFTELLAEQRRVQDLDRYIPELGIREIAAGQVSLLRANARNPFLGGTGGELGPWLALFAKVFTSSGLEAPTVGSGAGHPF